VGHLETGAPYIVMEYLEGEDLDAILDRGPMATTTAIDYLIQACEAVAEAHSLGIVHRDLKPKNLFLTRRVNGKPLVKVLDFGISKSTTDNLSLTTTQQGLGSPNYMSPEQLRCARDVDQRTDIWSLGIILYELLTVRMPFEAETVTHLTALVLQDEPRPLAEHRSDVPPQVAAVIAKCLQKSPDQRYQSVIELVEALVPFVSSEGMIKAGELLGGVAMPES
jgi:serine/threonine-protein kinase